MSNELYTNVAFLRAKTGKTEELGKELVGLVAQTRTEAGNYAYDVHRSADDPNLWLVYEVWRSKKDLDDHFQLPFMQAFIPKVPALIDGDMDLRHFRPVAAKPAEGK
jgi:quinol monooxygenase YgiN